MKVIGADVSILMSCYSADDPEYFSEALDSLLTQSVKPLELVLVCDGPLGDILENVISKFRVKFEKAGISFVGVKLDTNKGLGLALKEGARNCKGLYIMRMDADDICISNRLEKLLAIINENQSCAVIGTQIEEFVTSDNDSKRLRPIPIGRVSMKDCNYRNPLNHVSVVIKRETYEKFGGYEDVNSFEDYFLWLKLLNNGQYLMNQDEIHVRVRVSDLLSRRTGISYAIKEFNFAKLCFERGYFSFFRMVTFCVVRIPARFLPASIFKLLLNVVRGVK